MRHIQSSYTCTFVLVFSLLFFSSFTLRSQFYNMPGDYAFSLLTQKQLAQKDSSLHSGIQPYIPFFSSKYAHVADSHRVFKYIVDDPALETVFYKHLLRVEPKNNKFKLRLDPLLNFETGKGFSHDNNQWLYTNTRGYIGSGYIGSKFYFETMFAENQSVFPIYVSEQTYATTVVPGQGRWKRYKYRGYDYAFSSGFISFQAAKNLNIQAGHGKQKIGNGYRSLLLSDNAFNYPYARITQQWFKGRVQYSNIYAVMMNLVSASVKINPNTERLFQKKAASFQYLSINATKSFNIGFFQGLIWQAGDDRNKQHLAWQYFNPVIYTNLASYGLNNKNNLLIGTDLKLKVTKTLNVYGQLMADDLSNTKKKGNGYGIQAGINYYDALGLKNLFFQTEFNYVSETSYNNPLKTIPDQSYSQYGQTLAFTPGNGSEFIFIADYKWHRFFVDLKYNYQSTLLNNADYSFNNIIMAKVGYLINPSYNLNIMAGITYRTQNFHNFKSLNNETNYIYLGFRTSLYNLYYDF